MKAETKSFTWVTKTGNKIEYVLGCEYRSAYDELLDGGYGGAVSHKAEVVFTARVSANGNLLFNKEFGSILHDAEAYKDSTAKQVLAAGERYYIAAHGKNSNYCIITIPESIYNDIKNAMSDFENSFGNIVEQKAEKLEAEKAELVDFIEKSEKQNWLPTEEEYRVWCKKYNDMANEGGEGYVPETSTKEALEYAKLRLEEISK